MTRRTNTLYGQQFFSLMCRTCCRETMHVLISQLFKTCPEKNARHEELCGTNQCGIHPSNTSYARLR